MSSSEEEEEEEFLLAKYGTPMEELDDPDIPKKNIAVHEQIVTDEQGRRRFHGAFTGGFSAGYYNTVDTPEGWTPSSFRSTRKDRKANKVYAPEDFMDEEDLSEYGIAPIKIVPQSSFATSKNDDDKNLKRKEHFAKNATMLLGLDMLQSLVIPVSNNIGTRLLQKMGWKPGQGVGPKIKRPKKNAFIPENVEFAPQDWVPMEFNAKTNAFGLGYTGMDPKRALHDKVKKSSAIAIRTKSGAKLSFAGQAFGVGAYEDDDNDIYAQDSMANYDLEISEEKHDNSYGWSKPKKAIVGADFKQAIEHAKKVLENFKKAEKFSRRKVYAPPILPPDYDPNRRLKAMGRFSSGVPRNHSELTEEEEREKKFERLAPDQRGEMLSEKQRRGEKPADFSKDSSIFALLEPKDRERLQILRHGGIGQPLPARQPKKRGFHEPFRSDPTKQARYEEYLKILKNKETDPYTRIQHDPNMTEWERDQEKEEFVKTSKFFQPLSATMSSRFATESEDFKQQDAREEAQKKAVEMKMFGIMTRETVEWHPDRLLCKRFNVPNPYPHSDIVGIPGHETTSFGDMFLHPDDFKSKTMPGKLQPGLEMNKIAITAGPKSTGVLSDTKNPPLFNRITSNKASRWDKKPVEQLVPNNPQETNTQVEQPDVTDQPEEMDVPPSTGEEDNGESSDSEEENEEEKPTRPSMDLFKAIFANSDDSSSSDDDEDVEIPTRSSKNETKSDSKDSTASKLGPVQSKDAKNLTDTEYTKSNGVDKTGGDSTPTLKPEVNRPSFHKFTRPNRPSEKDKESEGADGVSDVNQTQFHKLAQPNGNLGTNNEKRPEETEEGPSKVNLPHFHKFTKPGGAPDASEKTGPAEMEVETSRVNQPQFHKFSSKRDRSTVTPSTEESDSTISEKLLGAPPPGDTFGPCLPPVKVPKLWETTDPKSLKHKKAKKSKHKKHKHKKEKKKK